MIRSLQSDRRDHEQHPIEIFGLVSRVGREYSTKFQFNETCKLVSRDIVTCLKYLRSISTRSKGLPKVF